MLSPSDIEEIKKLVEQSHNILAVLLYGPAAVPTAWLTEAIAQGFVDLAKPADAILKDLYAFGTYMAHMQDPTAATVTTLDAFLEIVRANPVPQTLVEAHAAQISLTRAAANVSGLGTRFGASVGSTITAASAAHATRYRGLIRDVLAARSGDRDAQARITSEGIEQGKEADFFDGMFRKTAQQMASDLGHLTEDWERDLLRITVTESTQTMNEAMAERWKEEDGDPEDILVYRSVRPDACSACKGFYLDGLDPRIFRLAGLEANGSSNAGRKRSAWRPVNGATHPWCFPPGVPVKTSTGDLPIEVVKPGMLVLTHRGRWRRVAATMARPFGGDLHVFDGLPTTPEHPLLTPRGWVKAKDLQVGNYLIEPTEIRFTTAQGRSGDSIRHPAQYRTVAVGHKSLRQYEGQVFNLAVEGDESFVAAGRFVHNCSCVTVRLSRFVDVPRSWKQGQSMPKVIGPKGYIT